MLCKVSSICCTPQGNLISFQFSLAFMAYSNVKLLRQGIFMDRFVALTIIMFTVINEEDVKTFTVI